jgi:hypothetical protein
MPSAVLSNASIQLYSAAIEIGIKLMSSVMTDIQQITYIHSHSQDSRARLARLAGKARRSQG